MTKRVYGLDLCRILSMLGIIILHIIGAGGAQQMVNGSYTARYWTAEWLYICALCSVDVFAIMSGYLGINKKEPSLYRVLELVAVVVFFCAISTACFAVFCPEKVLNVKAVIKGLFPPIADRYWYITNFIPIMLLRPLLNKMLLALSEKQHKALCIIGLIVFSALPTLARKDFYVINKGYSFVWLLCMYALGAYLKRSRIDTLQVAKKYSAIAFLLMSIFLLFGNIFAEFLMGKNYRYFVAYNSPVIVLMSISLFLLFKNLQAEKCGRLLVPLASVAFDVYIIHCHIFIYDYIIEDLFVGISAIPVYFIIPAILLAAVLIYIVCAAVGLLRTKLFNITGLNRLMKKCSAAMERIIFPDISA